MEEINEFYEQCLNKNQHLIDNKESNLSYEQKELLRIFLLSSSYFIPYTLDGNWSFADSMKVIDKVELTEALASSNQWQFDVSSSSLKDDIYIIEIFLHNNDLKEKILAPYKKFKNHYLEDDIKSNIELYISYDDMLNIYKKKICQTGKWNEIIQKKDL